MNNSLINNISKLVQKACLKDSNIFGPNIWHHHILPVVKHSRLLAEKFNIDVECAIITAYLHDYASVINEDLYPQHHIHGSRIAEDILTKENYPEDKTEIVKRCIFNHRGSIKNTDSCLEIICIASADAMAHITELPSLLYLAYHQKDMGVTEGCQWVQRKINKSWNKLCVEAREMVKDIYLADIAVLNGNKKSVLEL